MLDVWLRTEWLSCRKNSVLRCVERYSAAAASEYRRALRKEALNRRLSAANAEIRRYQTRLFACEREVVALRQENAELEALCDQARKNELLPQKRPQPPVLDQPGLPVIVFPGQAKPEAEAPAPEETRPEPPHRRRKSSHPPLNKRTGSPPPPSISFRWTSYINWKP